MSLVGRLLVATPLIGDPNFERTVILVLGHDRHAGAIGVVLNRPSDLAIADVAAELVDAVSAPGVVFVGGPVAPGALVGLARRTDIEPNQLGLFGDVVNLDLEVAAQSAGTSFNDLRLFLGSAGWAGGQLEDEIADGAWWVVDGTPTDISTSDPDGLWRRVLRRQTGRVAWFADCPLDPTQN